MIEHAVIGFYRFWHGMLHLKGAGILLSRAAALNPKLHGYKLRLPEGTLIEVDFRDVSAIYWLNHLLGDSFEEHGLLTALNRLLKQGDVVWDIGANSGLLSYLLARSGRVGELHSFEPNPKMSKIASQAVSSFSNSRVHPFGISNQNAEFFLTVPKGQTTKGTLEPETTERSGERCKVSCRAGDELVFKNGFRPPQVIKIDTEGHELAVISGLARTIEIHRPTIFFEHISIDIELLRKSVPGHYKLFKVCDATGELCDSDSDSSGHNSVLIPGE